MAYFVSSLSFILALMLQSGIVSSTPLLAGVADLILLTVIAWGLHQHTRFFWIVVLCISVLTGAISAEPFLVSVMVYMLVYIAAIWLREKILQSPLLAMFFLVFAGTILQHIFYMGSLFVSRTAFDWREAVFNILLPSLILNMLLAIPLHALVQELARTSQPKAVEP